ncbi:cytochrome P450 [Sinosporangium siamense]|uniref:cytochrome P450 n=1 Tax=Sinosporangium siamense TaxID=1367973 RepID=UPI001EF27983|nr:cytochrome P450 [Sinosporangium siamense]
MTGVRLPSGDTAWLVTGYAQVRQVLADPRFSRAAAAAPGAPRLGPAAPERSAITTMDPPDHTRLRRLIAPAFSARRIGALQPHVERLVAGVLDAMAAAGPPYDLVEGLARPLPVKVICKLLGVPQADRTVFERWVEAALSVTPGNRAKVEQARAELRSYFRELVARKRAESASDDVLAYLINAHDEDDRLSEDELLALASTLLTAGCQTVTTALANGAAILLRHPGQVALIRRRPQLLPAAIDEVLRYTPGPVSGGTIRVAVQTVELGGVTISPGEAVIPSTTSANRDASVFPQADTFDVTRPGNPHVAFGPGIHHCLGRGLAQMELVTAFGGLIERFPGLRIAVPEEELRWSSGGILRALTALPVAWGEIDDRGDDKHADAK